MCTVMLIHLIKSIVLAVGFNVRRICELFAQYVLFTVFMLYNFTHI